MPAPGHGLEAGWREEHNISGEHDVTRWVWVFVMRCMLDLPASRVIVGQLSVKERYY
jgi:hypothetical protein